MPLLKENQVKQGVYWGIWNITESEEHLHQAYPFEEVKSELGNIKIELRRKQWLAGRILVGELLKKRSLPFEGIWKDQHEKAFLKDSNFSISLSHSGDYAVAIVDEYKSTGIDIEMVQPKIHRVAGRILNEAEMNLAGENTKELTAYWCAKEALYKLYGKREVIFKEELFIEKPNGDSNFMGKVRKNGFNKNIPMKADEFGDFMIVHSH
ncbi:4'-phosphopantetheinyl transferase superfamily protein [Flammeovirgaceae bacterium SG7u.111]|nr:4'-phosphopantetheinyl transferase superfamily protein [Flammeovirgaceae bacterium SG7u.132]WPO38647.1 4'-phosphopantetheinyl transferase superfamily protein [Flammeovirgaceae bacterium SG7u.111]